MGWVRVVADANQFAATICAKFAVVVCGPCEYYVPGQGCVPKVCGDCEECNPDTGECVSTCGECEKCDNGECVPTDCAGDPDAPDNDQDGVCVCEDCDDNDPNNFPGNTEDCNDGQDNDCDGLIDCADPDCPCCSLNITTDPGNGSAIYIYDLTAGDGTYSPTDPGWISYGTAIDSFNDDIPCGDCYQVWVTKPGLYYMAKNITGRAGPAHANWCCEGAPVVYGCASEVGQYNLHFEALIGCLPDGDPCTTLDTQTIVSDANTTVTAGNTGGPYPYPAVPAWEPNDDTDPSQWDTSINYAFLNGSDWIWESYRVQNPEDGDVVSFERIVNIPDDAYAIVGTIYITCDNGYELWLNGSFVGSAQVHDYNSIDWQDSLLTEDWVNTSGWQTVEAFNLLSWLTTGVNTFVFECADEQMDGGTIDSNPAGLIFEIYIAYCVPTGPDCSITLDTDAADGTVCANSTGHTASVADAGMGATYTWTLTGNYSNLSGQGTKDISFDVGSAGSLNVMVEITDGNGCYCTDNEDITMVVCGGPGPGVGPVKCYLWVDMLGEIYRVEMKCCPNESVDYHKCLDPDGLQFLEIDEDMEIICGDCAGSCTDNPKDCTDCNMCRAFPKVIVMSLAEESPTPPDGTVVVGGVYYDLTGYKDTLRTVECEIGTFFYPAISMLLIFDPDTLDPGASNPRIAWYDAELGVWNPLPYDPDRVAGVGEVTGETNVFASTFAILVDVPAAEPTPAPPPPATPEPAHFVVSNLNITPAEVKTEETVTISVNVANDGEQEGTYLVELTVNGQKLNDEQVTLGAGQSEKVTFYVSAPEPGEYEVVVSGLSGDFTVLGGINWWLWGSIIAVVILFISWLIWYRRRRMGTGAEPAP
jgi:hypothetical protein